MNCFKEMNFIVQKVCMFTFFELLKRLILLKNVIFKKKLLFLYKIVNNHSHILQENFLHQS